MKKNTCFLIMCIFAPFLSCKKFSTGNPADNTNLISVKEYKTNEPLEGVVINLYRCSNYDYVFGCQSKSLFASHATDSKGEYIFDQRELGKADEGIILRKSQYWDRGGGTGEVEMEPEAWANIRIKASALYPDSSMFLINATGELFFQNTQSFKAPKDSTARFRLFGNETNEISWTVYTRDPNCFFYCILDTLAHGTVTLNPQKFETLSSVINY